MSVIVILVVAFVFAAVLAKKSSVKLDSQQAFLGGVCAGVASHIGWPVMAVRIIWSIAFLAEGVGLIAYLVFFLVLREES